MIFSRLFRTDEARQAGRTLYELAVGQARLPVFYAELEVPDSLDGRFEAILLHVWLLLRRLRLDDEASDHTGKVSQAVFDAMINDMDRSLREMGVGDLRVGKRVKAMARSFYGHVQAYDESFDQSPDDMAQALRRNVYATSPKPDDDLSDAVQALADYVGRAALNLENQALEDIIGGNLTFVPPNRGESR